MKMKFSLLTLWLIFVPICYGQTSPSPARPGVTTSSVQPASLNACQGEKKPLTIANQMPFLLTQVGTAKGYFLIDFGSNQSYIDLSGFPAGTAPKPVTGSTDKFADFDFYGIWAPLNLGLRKYSQQGTVRQAGIIGTDLLAQNAFTIDYREPSPTEQTRPRSAAMKCYARKDSYRLRLKTTIMPLSVKFELV